MKVLLTGASGLLGGYLQPALRTAGVTLVPVSHMTPPRDPDGIVCDLTDERAATQLVAQIAPDLIIHGAALTDVDLCEAEPALADAVNRRSTEHLAAAAEKSGARLAFVSTDSVFDGVGGNYAEDAEPTPLNEYARSKVRAESHALATTRGICFRTNFFGRSDRGHGLAEWLLRELGAEREVIGFEDVLFTPLYCRDAAEAIAELALGDVRGIVHLSGDPLNKFEFALLVAEHFGFDGSFVRRGTVADVQLKAPRPRNTTLDNTLLQSLLGRQLRGTKAAVAAMAADDPAPGRPRT